MQLRKLIRLLNEVQEKVGPYAEVTIDTRRYSKYWHDSWTYDSIDDVTNNQCFWVKDDYIPENAKERDIVVLNPL